MSTTLKLTLLSLLPSILLPIHALAQEIKITVLDHQQQPVADIVAYLEPLDDIKVEPNNEGIEIGQLNKSFTPYISVMQKGSKVTFHNQDDITHHIYSPVGENKFSFKIRSGQSQLKQDFNQVGEIAMGCNIHDWMSGYLLVLDTPYFNKTNAEGVANINISEQGNYRLNIWHPQLMEENNKISMVVDTTEIQHHTFKLTKAMQTIPEQSNNDDFDFLSEY